MCSRSTVRCMILVRNSLLLRRVTVESAVIRHIVGRYYLLKKRLNNLMPLGNSGIILLTVRIPTSVSVRRNVLCLMIVLLGNGRRSTTYISIQLVIRRLRYRVLRRTNFTISAQDTGVYRDYYERRWLTTTVPTLVVNIPERRNMPHICPC